MNKVKCTLGAPLCYLNSLRLQFMEYPLGLIFHLTQLISVRSSLGSKVTEEEKNIKTVRINANDHFSYILNFDYCSHLKARLIIKLHSKKWPIYLEGYYDRMGHYFLEIQ